MRNLQKILALVLALVMSLSLMATAGATDFSDDAEIDETFRESVDVLNGLKVFQGYDNGAYFSPKGDITRAEVAAIIYRIATGDVTDSQVKIYADYNKFSDVPSDHWAAGYINYCTNAEYIKGRGDGKFYPQDKVTGYEALAMILRVVGYDKNGEFTGADWQVQTAATANQRKVTKNVNAGTLGTPASRETVAELLCQAILIEKVNYTLAFGYQISTDPKDTIAYETFKMQRLEGVVTGNEYADLDTHQGTALSAGQSRLELADGEKLTLTVGSDLDDIGESCRVYVVPGTSLRYDLVTDDVYATDKNTVYGAYDSEEGGEAVSVSSAASKINVIVNDDTQHFINFDQTDKYTTNIHMRYVIRLQMSEYDALMMYYLNGSSSNSTLKKNGVDVPYPSSIAQTVTSKWNKQVLSDVVYEYSKTINAFAELTATDWDNLRAIFIRADYTTDYEKGEVYVGTNTQSTSKKDVSDEITWDMFVKTYLVGVDNKQTISSNSLGYWLKVIDNDGDGVAEYVLQTRYTVAIANNVADGKCSLDNVNKVFGTHADNVNEITPSTKTAVAEDVVSGDKVLYAVIDGVARVQKAETVTTKVTSVNRANATATLEDGTVKDESAVHTHSDGLTSGVANLVLGTNYELIYDRYGNLAAFTEGANGQFTLITDAWSNVAIAGNEYTVRAYIDGSLQTQSITTNGGLFITGGASNWNKLKDNFGEGRINNENVNTNLTNNARTGNVHTVVATLRGGELMPVDKVNLYSQVNRMIDMQNNEIPGQGNVIKTGDTYITNYVNGTAYDAKDEIGVQVAALSNTVYYFVYNAYATPGQSLANGRVNTVVRQYTGFNSIPTVNKEYIEDVYAIGTRATNAANANYYTAQVVVVELNNNYTGSNAIDSEIVFVPSFDEVVSVTPAAADGARMNSSWGWGIEKVSMIREDGNVAEVYVDTANSKLDDYDTADGHTANNRTPGLFYMSESDKNPGSYILVRMTAAQIRGDGRLRVGFTNRSTATMVNNYATIDLIGRPSANLDAANPELTRFATDSRALITDNSVFYNLAYGGIGSSDRSAKLTTSDAANVLAQTKDAEMNWDNASITSTYGYLNESRNFDNDEDGTIDPQKDYLQRNEVLVVCNRGGSIVYAISFNEYSAKNAANLTYTRDYAQRVWADCLASAQDVETVNFYGDGSKDPDGVIRVSYGEAKNWDDQGKNAISVAGTNVQSWTLYTATEDYNALTKVMDETYTDKTRDPVPAGAKYLLVVKYYNNYNGGEVSYKLNQTAAATDATLTSTSPRITVNPYTNEIALPIAPDGTTAQAWPISEYLKAFEVSNNGTVEWTFTLSSGATFKATGVGENAVIDKNMPAGTTTTEIAEVVAVVKSQDGTSTVKTYATAASYVNVTVSQDTAVYDAATNVQLNPTQHSAGNSIYKLAKGTAVKFVRYGEGTFSDGTNTIPSTFADSKSTTDPYTVTAAVIVTFTESPKTAPVATIVTSDDNVTLPATVTQQGVSDGTNWTATFSGIRVAAGYELVTPAPNDGAAWSAAVTKDADGSYTVVYTMKDVNANVYSGLVAGKSASFADAVGIKRAIHNDKDVGQEITNIVDFSVHTTVVEGTTANTYYLSGTPSKVYTSNTSVTNADELEGLRQFWYGEPDNTNGHDGAAALVAMKAAYNTDFAIVPINTPDGVLFFAVVAGGTGGQKSVTWNYDDHSSKTVILNIDVSGLNF